MMEYNNMVEYLMKGEYPVELQGRYARSNFRRKASHYQVEGEKLYKASQIF